MQITSRSRQRSPNPLDSLTRRTASTVINFYQKQLSPHKGFSCAFRVLHRDESCSQYTKRIISELGIGQALPLIRQRFQACKAANRTLRAGVQCRSTRQQATVPGLTTIAPRENRSIALNRQPWKAMEGAPLDDDEPIELPDEHSEPGEEPAQRRTGGGSFRKPPAVSNAGATDGNLHPNRCPDGSCDSLECASLGCDAIDCSSADWSAMECGAADCSSLDCSSLDCGSCDFGSCDCSL